jgi:DNA-binding response OmpR family regulator
MRDMPQKILVVDDDKDIVHVLKSALEKHGYEVITASDGEEALKAIKTNVPGLIITDLAMPDMNGWYFSMKVRQDERFKTTPIIVLSGLLREGANPQAYEPGTVYIPKPFDIFELIVKIKDLLK